MNAGCLMFGSTVENLEKFDKSEEKIGWGHGRRQIASGLRYILIKPSIYVSFDLVPICECLYSQYLNGTLKLTRAINSLTRTTLYLLWFMGSFI